MSFIVCVPLNIILDFLYCYHSLCKFYIICFRFTSWSVSFYKYNTKLTLQSKENQGEVTNSMLWVKLKCSCSLLRFKFGSNYNIFDNMENRSTENVEVVASQRSRWVWKFLFSKLLNHTDKNIFMCFVANTSTAEFWENRFICWGCCSTKKSTKHPKDFRTTKRAIRRCWGSRCLYAHSDCKENTNTKQILSNIHDWYLTYSSTSQYSNNLILICNLFPAWSVYLLRFLLCTLWIMTTWYCFSDMIHIAGTKYGVILLLCLFILGITIIIIIMFHID